jgi:hypothetical protein
MTSLQRRSGEGGVVIFIYLGGLQVQEHLDFCGLLHGLHNRLKGTIISRQLRLLGSPDGRDSSILIH